MQEASLPAASETERTLAEVYARPEFADAAPSPLVRWLLELYGGLQELLRRLLPDVNLLRESSPVLFWLVVAWLALSALAIGAHLALTAAGSWRGRGRRTAGQEAGGERQEPVFARDAAFWEEEARRAAAAGRIREAALALYQAILWRLDQRGTVRYDPAKTPGDYRRESRTHRDDARALDRFLRLFEPVAFGGRPADEAVYVRLEGAAAEVGARG